MFARVMDFEEDIYTASVLKRGTEKFKFVDDWCYRPEYDRFFEMIECVVADDEGEDRKDYGPLINGECEKENNENE